MSSYRIHRIAYRIASHPIASHRTASHRIASLFLNSQSNSNCNAVASPLLSPHRGQGSCRRPARPVRPAPPARPARPVFDSRSGAVHGFNQNMRIPRERRTSEPKKRPLSQVEKRVFLQKGALGTLKVKSMSNSDLFNSFFGGRFWTVFVICFECP